MDLLDDTHARNAVQDFLDLCSRRRTPPLPFIGQGEYDEFCSRMETFKGPRGAYRTLFQLIHCGFRNVPDAMAEPELVAPHTARESWKCAARDGLRAGDWRSPQVIVPRVRRGDWPPGPEAAFKCEECGDGLAVGRHSRVLAVLEDYDAHPFAGSDVDPWDLRRIHPPIPDAPRQHPAFLPRPPELQGVRIEDLQVALPIAERAGWVDGGYRYFIPPRDFVVARVEQETWRKGRAFRYETAPGTDKSGPVDSRGIVWAWDHDERHWDVQTKPKHTRVSHTGEKLPDPQ